MDVKKKEDDLDPKRTEGGKMKEHCVRFSEKNMQCVKFRTPGDLRKDECVWFHPKEHEIVEKSRGIFDVQQVVVAGSQKFFVENGWVCGREKEEVIKICNFTVEFIKEGKIVSEESEKGGKGIFYVKIKSEMCEAKVGILAMDRLYNPVAYQKICGGYGIVKRKGCELFREYILEKLGKIIPFLFIFQKTGWCFDSQVAEQAVFTLPNFVVGETKNGTECQMNKSFVSYEEVRQNNSAWILKQILSTALEIAPYSVTVPLFLWSHIAILGRLFGEAGVPVKFTLALIGVTNSRKTSLATALCQMYDRENLKPQISFESTLGGLEKAMSDHPDEVLIVDDLRPGRNKKETQEYLAKLDFVVRAMGDGVEKKRQCYFSLRDEELHCPVRTYPLITGEFLNATASTMTRIVKLNIGKNDVDNQKLSWLQDDYKVIQIHLAYFVIYVQHRWLELVKFIHDNTKMIRKNISHNFKVPRYAEDAAIFDTTINIVQHYAYTMGFDDKETKIFEKMKESIWKVLRENDSMTENENPVNILLRALIWKQQTNPQNLVEISQVKSCKNVDKKIIMDDEVLYLKKDYFFQLVREFCEFNKLFLPLRTVAEMIAALKAENLIFTQEENGQTRNTVKVTRVGNVRFLAIKREAIEKFKQEIE